MPVARYFVCVGTVLLALLFIADAWLPHLPAGKADVPIPVVRIHSDRKWPERIVFDTSAPMPQVAAVAAKGDSKRQAVAMSDRMRDAFAQLQKPDDAKVQAKNAKTQDVRHPQKIARRHIARPPPRDPRQYQYAWSGERMWW